MLYDDRARYLRELDAEVKEVRRLSLIQRRFEESVDKRWNDLCEQEYVIEKPIVSKYTIRRKYLYCVYSAHAPELLKYFEEFAPYAVQFGVGKSDNSTWADSKTRHRVYEIMKRHIDEWW